MARSLYSKFVLGYLIFGLLSVLTIATFSSGITRDYLIKDRANALYDEANDIAASCSLMYQGQHQDMDLFSTQLKNVSTYLHTETWVVNKSGVVIMDSKNGSRVHTTIPDFDPTATGNRSYTIGTYYKLFDQNVKQSRLVKARREGKTVFYSLADGHVRTILDQGMEHVAELLPLHIL